MYSQTVISVVIIDLHLLESNKNYKNLNGLNAEFKLIGHLSFQRWSLQSPTIVKYNVHQYNLLVSAHCVLCTIVENEFRISFVGPES